MPIPLMTNEVYLMAGAHYNEAQQSLHILLHNFCICSNYFQLRHDEVPYVYPMCPDNKQ